MKKALVVFLTLIGVLAGVYAQNIEFTPENLKNSSSLRGIYKKYILKGDKALFKADPDYETALSYYLKAYTGHNKSAVLDYKIALCYLHSSDQSYKGIPFALASKELNPQSSYDIDYILGSLYMLQQEYEPAIKHYTQFIADYPGNVNDSLLFAANEINECRRHLSGAPVKTYETDSLLQMKIVYDQLKKELMDSIKKELNIIEEPVYDKIPFNNDFSWMNGNNRQKTSLIHGKNWNVHLMFDTYIDFSSTLPVDHTINTSSTIGRTGEFTVNTATVGVEYTYRKVFAKFSLQTGSMMSVVQETDLTVNHGRNLRTDDLKFIREAIIGYKFNKLYGITLEGGIFMSFIGTESYNTQENWCYQRAFAVDFTPFYFVGVRSQIHLTKDFKIEPWIMNGWYSYGMFNHRPSYGICITYRPKEWMGWVANFYIGSDTKLIPDRIRAHSDFSVQIRYVNRPGAKGLSKAAFHINGQYGFEDGGFDTNGVALPTFNETYFAAVSASNRLWFFKDHFGWTLRGGFVKNPGRYLPFVPTAYGYIDNPTNDPRKDFFAYEFTTTFDFMINDYLTIRLEYLYRKANLPYFQGHGGTTAPDGWQPGNPSWTPDLVDYEHRWLVNFNVRF